MENFVSDKQWENGKKFERFLEEQDRTVEDYLKNFVLVEDLIKNPGNPPAPVSLPLITC